MLDVSALVTPPGPPTEIVLAAPAGLRSDPAALLTDAVIIVLRMIETEAAGAHRWARDEVCNALHTPPNAR